MEELANKHGIVDVSATILFFIVGLCFAFKITLSHLACWERGACICLHILFLFLSQHFQSILQTLEEQVGRERQRLVETHLARVVALLNDNRRAALENYLTAMQSDNPQVGKGVEGLSFSVKTH